MAENNSTMQLQEKVQRLEARLVERDQQIALLQENASRYTVLIQNTADLIHSVTPEGSFLFVNEAWKKTLGYDDEEIKRLKLMDIVAPGCRNECTELFSKLIKGTPATPNTTIFLAKDGREVRVEGRCNTSFKDGKAVSMTGVFRDLTHQQNRDAALVESEERYRDLFENATDLIQLVAPDGMLLYANQAWQNTFGYTSEDIDNGLSIFDLIDQDCQDHCMETFSKVVTSPEVNYIDTVFTGKDGQKVIIQGNGKCKFVDGKPLQIQCIFRDVTKQKKMEEELLKNQKIESLGILAGGIAHDFNNMLTGILGNISLAKLHVDKDSKIFKYLSNTEKVSERAKGLTQQLLTFSKGGAPVKTMTSITDLVKDSVSFILRGSNVSHEFDFTSEPHVVDVDEGQLSQVVQNLVVNANQAMPDGGKLVVSCANIHLDTSDRLPLPDGQYVHLTFTDQGCGIPQANMDKIFDPYFSSKETGNGLGLAVSYSIMKNHDGLIRVQSKLGKGSQFTLYLPIIHQQGVVAKKAETDDVKISGKILVMDDEPFVRETAREMLEYFGCKVVVSTNGYEAISLYEAARDKGEAFNAVVLDLTIPGSMGGLETLEELKDLHPEVKALVSSGYANDPAMAHYLDYGFVGVIPKPFNIQELQKTLSQVLAS